MKRETNLLFGLLLLMTAMMLFAAIILNNSNKKLRRELDSLQRYVTTKVDTFTKVDTLYVDSAITDKHPTKVIWMYQKKKNESTGKVEAVPIPKKLNVWEGEIGNDSAKIHYKAYLSPQAKLDSIDINYKIRLINQAQTINKEVVKTITIDKAKQKHWYNRFHISVQAGYGYGFKYKGLEPYVGLGGSFDL